MTDSLWLHGLQHARLPCPSLSPGVCSNSCPFCRWCYLTISSSATYFFCFQSFPASGSFPVSWLYASGGQITGASASTSILPMTVQGWFPLGLTDLISLHWRGLFIRVSGEMKSICLELRFWRDTQVNSLHRQWICRSGVQSQDQDLMDV